MQKLIALTVTAMLLSAATGSAQHGGEMVHAVFIMNADGSGQRPLFPYPVEARHLACSPDGTRIAYTGRGFGGTDIFVCNIDGSNVTNLTKTKGIMELNPAWSPGNQHIAFRSNAPGNGDIFSTRIDGGPPRNLTDHPAADSRPAWSPDGARIAFMSDRTETGKGRIFVMNSDGSSPHELNVGFDEYTISQPAWSADGTALAFVVLIERERHIYTKTFSNGTCKPIISAPYRSEQPAWSPDGSRIAFTSNKNGNSDIFVYDVHAGETRNLTRGEGINFYPTWTPDGRIIFATRRTLDQLGAEEQLFLGPTSVVTILEDGGLAIQTRNGNVPPVRLQRMTDSGEFEYIPLDRTDAIEVLKEHGISASDVERLFTP